MGLHVNISSIYNVLHSCALTWLAYLEYSEEGNFVRKCMCVHVGECFMCMCSLETKAG